MRGYTNISSFLINFAVASNYGPEKDNETRNMPKELKKRKRKRKRKSRNKVGSRINLRTLPAGFHYLKPSYPPNAVRATDGRMRDGQGAVKSHTKTSFISPMHGNGAECQIESHCVHAGFDASVPYKVPYPFYINTSWNASLFAGKEIGWLWDWMTRKRRWFRRPN